ncbi:MAG: FAD-dependent monooxygenase [Solirubrobacteraceae bacterium]
MTRALIIGGGPAGTVAAGALRRGGWEPEIFEAYDHSAGLDQGVFLTVAVNGFDALAAIGAAGAIGGLGFPTGQIRFANAAGTSLGAMPIGPVLADGTRTRTLRRSELYATLTDLATDRGIPIHHGRRLTGIDDHGGAITASFADGSSATGAVLIGADGLRSTVRALIDPSAPAPRYTGMGNAGAFTRTDVVAPDGGDYRMIWGRRSFFGYTVAPDGEVWWFANPPAKAERSVDELAALTPEARKAGLAALFADDAGPAAEIIASTPGDVLLGNQFDLPRVPTWHRGRAVIIGDAAHAVSPSTGQGVSLACEDAVVLAQCLRDAPSPQAAFVAYEARRRVRVEKVVAWGAKMGGTKTPGPVMRHVYAAILPMIFKAAATPKAMEKQAWLFGHHIDWDAPGVPVGAAR